MSLEEQNAVYADLQAAYEAYEALTDEQKTEVTGTELFESLFDCVSLSFIHLCHIRFPLFL